MSNNITYVDESFPELAKNFKDQSKIHVTKSCKDTVELICPCCKKEYKSKVVDYIKAGHVPCLTCNDGFSYPEKLMGNILKQLNIKYEYQYSPEWAKPYKYDFYFIYNNQKYIVETDGGLGHGYNNAFDRTTQECLEVDKIKDNLASQHNINVIRIDCNYVNYNRFNYIKPNIIKELSSIIPLDNIDWDYCNLQSLKSKFQEVIEIYKSGTKCLEDISNICNIKTRTVIKYITEAMDNGLIPKEKLIIKKNPKPTGRYRIKEARIISKDEATKDSIFCYEDALLFKTMGDAIIYYGYMKDGFYLAIRENNGYFKGRHFIKYKNLPRDFDFNRKIFNQSEYNNSGSKKIICQYTLDDKLKRIYIRKEEIPKNMSFSNIWRACVNQRKSAYGYKWKILDKKNEFEIFEMIRANQFARFYFVN